MGLICFGILGSVGLGTRQLSMRIRAEGCVDFVQLQIQGKVVQVPQSTDISFQAWNQDFGQGGSGVLTPRGALSPNFAQNRGFPLKIA